MPKKEKFELRGRAFARWMEAEMAAQQLTAQGLSEKSQVSLPTIYNIINGDSENPQESTKKKISDALKAEIPADVIKEIDEDTEILGLGNLIDFDPYDDKYLPDVAGVYVFYDIAKRPMYVGQSKDISRRVREHADRFWFKKPLVEFGAYIKINDEKLRRQTESILIGFLKSNAALNKQQVLREE